MTGRVEWSNRWPDGVVIASSDRSEERARQVNREIGLPIVKRTVSDWEGAGE